MPSKPIDDQRGYIMPIGGGEDKFASPTVCRSSLTYQVVMMLL